MLTALIRGGMRQGTPQRFPIEGHLDVLRSRFGLGQQSTGFSATATRRLQPR